MAPQVIQFKNLHFVSGPLPRTHPSDLISLHPLLPTPCCQRTTGSPWQGLPFTEATPPAGRSHQGSASHHWISVPFMATQPSTLFPWPLLSFPFCVSWLAFLRVVHCSIPVPATGPACSKTCVPSDSAAGGLTLPHKGLALFYLWFWQSSQWLGQRRCWAVIHRGLAELSPNGGSSLSHPLPLQPTGLVCVEFGI